MTRLITFALLALLTVGCKKKPPEEVVGPTDTAPPITDNKPPAKPDAVQKMAENFNRVFFEFDATTLTAEGKSALDGNAAIMSEYSDLKLEIQGHADERGTTEYNIALGQKRADSVVQYMLARGVASSRVKSVSYGEERPLDGRSTEVAWEQNRRAEFVITWSGDAPVTGTVPK